MADYLATAGITFISLLVVNNFSKNVNFNGVLPMLFLSLVLTLPQSTIQPILMFLGFPITVMTLGIFGLIINGFVLTLAFRLTDGAHIKTFGSAVFLSIVISLLNSLFTGLFLG